MDSILMLRVAAQKRRRVTVVTAEGGLPGYLLGIDRTHLVLYAQFRKNEETVDWAVVVVPRTLVTMIEEAELSSEAEAVQAVYTEISKKFLAGNTVLLHGEEEDE